jgi:hypothetical protein
MSNPSKRSFSIYTRNGALVAPLTMKGAEFDHEVIAHSLACQCRYLGHTKKFYSIAQHSCHVHDILPPEFRFVGLMHDAPEAYLGDVVTPIKRNLIFKVHTYDEDGEGGLDFISFDDVEQSLWERMAEHYGLPTYLPEVVQRADWYLFNVEVRDACDTDVTAWGMKWGPPPTPEAEKLVITEFWTPERAREEWLSRFREYR